MTRFPTVLPALLLALAACGGTPQEKEVEGTFQAFLGALERADGAGLWALADEDTRTYFDALAKDVRETLAAIDRHYPEKDRAAARRAVGADWAGTHATGQTLFAALLDPRRLAAPPDPAAREVERIVFEGDDATVVLKSGDTLQFRRAADGTWRTGLFLAAFRDLPGLQTLRDNLMTAKQNCTIHSGAAAQEATAPSPARAPTPGGAP